jgi:hypothetical protein
VNPIVVSIDLPLQIAVIDEPLPRWQDTILRFSNLRVAEDGTLGVTSEANPETGMTVVVIPLLLAGVPKGTPQLRIFV